MHNKELLMAGASKAQKEVRFTVGYSEVVEAYGMRYNDFSVSFDVGGINVLPYWNTSFLASILEDELTRTLYVSLSTPNPNFSLCVKNRRGSNQLTWLSDDSQTAMAKSALALRDDVNAEIILTFDPPPRRVLGSKHAQTNLGIGYYVEEVPWEAQNAEQGASDDRWCRGVVDYAILSYRRHLCTDNASTSRREHCLGRESRSHYYDVACATAECTKTYVGRWSCGDHTTQRHSCRTRWHTRNSLPHSTRQYISRGTLRSLTSKEALYA